MDVDGRVLRVDSFSKILAPGMRLGSITCSPLFHKYLIELTDNSTQQPAGFGQLFLTELLGEEGWTLGGFAQWVKSLSAEYERRRNFLLDLFETKIAPTGYATVSKPQAGMFVWVKINIEKHPRYVVKDNGKNKPKTNCMELVQEVGNSTHHIALHNKALTFYVSCSSSAWTTVWLSCLPLSSWSRRTPRPPPAWVAMIIYSTYVTFSLLFTFRSHP